MRPLMVLGCTSDAGKSLISTALCRWFARQGVRVAPFKAQNMSNNARVVDGAPSSGEDDDTAGEIGVAQWLQARAARIEPDVRMNPVLVKPEADTESQVIVRGRVDREVSATPWRDRHDALWEPMATSFDDLARDVDLVVIEGAGSPAEINLRDQVNNRMVDHADATALLVSDIDRGGSFAHLFGTWSLVPESTQRRLAGFVLNRFRGDASLLDPGPRRLTELTGMASVGVVPMLAHDLPREEGAQGSEGPFDPRSGTPRVVIPRLPFGSNLDEFQLLRHAAHVSWTTNPADLDRLDPELDLVVLPGSKHVLADMKWLADRGFDDAVRQAAAEGVRVIGVCGGAMMLGRSFHDPDGMEGGRATDAPVDMLGLLDLHTVMEGDKRVRRTAPEFGDAWWSAVGRTGCVGPSVVDGYEIRYGDIRAAAPVVGVGEEGPVAWSSGRVGATTVHGLFERTDVIEAVVGPSLTGRPIGEVVDATFERLADAVDEHLDTDLLWQLVGW